MRTRRSGTIRTRPIQLSLVLDLALVGGAEVLYLDLLRNLDPALVSPRLVCLRETGPLGADAASAGVPVEVLGRKGRYDVTTVPRLVRSFRRNRTDVVMVTHHHRASLLLGRIAARIAGVPANIIAPQGFSTSGHPCLPWYARETLFLSQALVLTAPSHGEYLHRQEGVGRFPWRRVPEQVIPNGVRLPDSFGADVRAAVRDELGLDPADFVVGIVARLSQEKAHQVLFRAIARLAPSMPRLRLVVVGTGPREAELHELVDRLGIRSNVMFTGLRRDVPRLLSCFDVLALSSVNECQPLSVIEAMHAGLPVVATDCGTLRDMLSDGVDGFIVPVADDAALAERVAKLAGDAELRHQMGMQARSRAEQEHTVAVMARRFTDLLIEITAPHRELGLRDAREFSPGDAAMP